MNSKKTLPQWTYQKLKKTLKKRCKLLQCWAVLPAPRSVRGSPRLGLGGSTRLGCMARLSPRRLGGSPGNSRRLDRFFTFVLVFVRSIWEEFFKKIIIKAHMKFKKTLPQMDLNKLKKQCKLLECWAVLPAPRRVRGFPRLGLGSLRLGCMARLSPRRLSGSAGNSRRLDRFFSFFSFC